MPVQVDIYTQCFFSAPLPFLSHLVIYCRNFILFHIINVSFQGGVGITRSLDELAAKYLRYDYTEPPRLVSFKVLWLSFGTRTLKLLFASIVQFPETSTALLIVLA